MRTSALSVALATLVASHSGHAQTIINELTFGHTGREPRRQPRAHPQLRHLGPPAAAAAPVDAPDRHEVGTHSIYTVGRFDGLALVVDTHGGSGGMVRGFLNDGTTDYAHHHHVDALAFGHCQYSYRNLGRPSSIKMRQTHAGFRVEVDGHPCFDTDKVSIPAGYHFGITAASPDTPDSFEIFKFVVQSDSTVSSGGGDHARHNANKKHPQQQQQHQHPQHAEPLPDESATHFKTSTAQFEDLHNRVQAMGHQLANIYEAVAQHHHENEQWHQQANRILEGVRSQLTGAHQDVLANKVKDLETELRAMHNDMSQRLVHHHDSLRTHMNDHHLGLADAMVYAVPGHGKLIFIFVGTQLLLVGAYVAYKRRRANMPKKYL
ncbi:hypothetical protein HIM_07257 [Hirsutella minnesotensis 3608]|uniref:L-type lectin-like domain-containing protein n=1 Tax=Hirsutella minnesotensis 3608 TaxID=1043627 RepID=A0A0F7ZTP3_9HYPO|nr:hypothetical protein HIM_07257 [Hirsutella minnesotensis 3608]